MSALAQYGEDIDEEDGDGDERDTEIKDAGGDGDMVAMLLMVMT